MRLQRGIVTPFSDRSLDRAPRWRAAPLILCLALALAGCGGGGGGSVNIANSQGPDPGTVDFPVFYVKRTIPKTSDDLRMMRVASPSADLYMRSAASPDAPETNITARITAGATYDVKDVDVSPDGTKVAFAMRGPITSNMDPADAPSWRIYEYTIATNTLAPMIDPSADTAPDTVNDVSPHYLPDGSIVFSSTRQRNSQPILTNEGKPQFIAQDEARTEPIFNLHVIDPHRTKIDQISFNQSHDRDATVLADGRILFTRWNHTPGKDQMDLFTIDPDGTDLELYYGAQSHMTGTNGSVIEFSHPHEMQSGDILVIARQYTGVDFGGQLEIIDGRHYVENTQPLLAYPTLTGPAQTAATPNQVSTLPGPSAGGRFNSAWPLWDGTGRILVSWTECRLLDNAQSPPTVVPCTTQALQDPTAQAAPPLYSLWMFDPAQNTFTPIIQPAEGVMITDVAAAQPRTVPTIIPPITPDPELQGEGVGEIDIKSVYDFDGVDTAPDGGIVALSDGKTPASDRPARFIRLVKAVSIPDRKVVNLAQEAFGASDYMREIMGYAPIEPDGSVKIKVPSDVAFEIEILDANARRLPGFPEHSDWLQVRAGEVLKCNGCHAPPTTAKPYSHGRAGLFATAYAGAAGGAPFPDSVATYLPQAGDTMAEARARVTCEGSALSTAQCSMTPSIDVFYTDVWTDTAQGLPANKDITYRYSALPTGEVAPIPAATPGCEGTWASNCRVVIDYPEHIQKIWDTPHTVNDPKNGVVSESCSSAGCHDANDANNAHLDLTNTASNDDPAELVSYRDLLFAHNVPGPPDANGNPTTISVGPFLDAGDANGAASRASLALFDSTTGDKIHAGSLSGAELRLISEWLDIGAQNFNNPFDPNVPKN